MFGVLLVRTGDGRLGWLKAFSGQLGTANPILSIHDVGAGGLSNALPELVHGGGKGGRFELRAAPSEDSGMSPREIWCNEAQERYVLIVRAAQLEEFAAFCARERCPHAVIGVVTLIQLATGLNGSAAILAMQRTATAGAAAVRRNLENITPPGSVLIADQRLAGAQRRVGTGEAVLQQLGLEPTLLVSAQARRGEAPRIKAQQSSMEIHGERINTMVADLIAASLATGLAKV